MKKIQYKVAKDENIGLIPYESIVNCFLIFEDVSGDNCLIYMPKKIKYITPSGIEGIDTGCGSISFGKKSNNYYIKSNVNYINLENKDTKLIEAKL